MVTTWLVKGVFSLRNGCFKQCLLPSAAENVEESGVKVTS